MSLAVVTGGSSGIGRGTAVRLARRGFGVILTYSGNEQGGRETVAAFAETVARTLDEVWGATTFTSLVNNAGFSRTALIEDTSEELFDDVVGALLKGPYVLTQALLPLLADGGAVVNTTSTSALPTCVEPGFAAYASAKGGLQVLQVLTRYMAKEFSARGIRVNAVAPGPTRTRLADDAFSKHPEVIAPLAAATALGRVGEAEDIGMVIATLLSEEGRWITGQSIEASGGHNL